MSAERLLIRNGFVVSMDPGVGDIPKGDVLVEDGRSSRSAAACRRPRQRRSTPRA